MSRGASRDTRPTLDSRLGNGLAEESEGLMVNIRSVNGDPDDLRMGHFSGNPYQEKHKIGSQDLGSTGGKENSSMSANRMTEDITDKRSNRMGCKQDSQDSKVSVLTWAARARSTGSRSSAVLSQEERRNYRESLAQVNQIYEDRMRELERVEKQINQESLQIRMLEDESRLLEFRSRELDEDLSKKRDMTFK